MLAHVLLVLLSAAPPAAEATKLAEAKAWDDLYLKYSAVDPAQYAAKDRESIGKALLAAGHGLEGSDPVLALSLAERSAAFHETSAAWLLAGELSQKLDQNAAAAKALERAVVLDPANDKAKMLRADLAFKEGDLLLAENLYESIPEASPHRAAAQSGLEKARKARVADTERLAELQKIERDLQQKRTQADKEVDTQPLTLLDVCRVHAVATCEALKRCQPELAGDVSDCSQFTSACTGISGNAPFSRGELESCRVALGKADCSKVQVGTLPTPGRIAKECEIFERIPSGKLGPLAP